MDRKEGKTTKDYGLELGVMETNVSRALQVKLVGFGE